MSADPRTLARTVEPIGDELFGIVWADGHESVYAVPELREACPCASCLEKRKGRPAESGAGLSLPVIGTPGSGAPPAIARWEPVGRYAVRFFWADGHDTGIFTFEYLRAICPCETCTSGREARARASR